MFLATPRLLGRVSAVVELIAVTTSTNPCKTRRTEDVDFLLLNTRLLLSRSRMRVFEVMPIAQISRTGGANSAPE